MDSSIKMELAKFGATATIDSFIRPRRKFIKQAGLEIVDIGFMPYQIENIQKYLF